MSTQEEINTGFLQRLAKVESSYDHISKQIDLIYTSDTKLYRDIRIFVAAMATIAVLWGAVNYSINNSQIKDASKDVQEKFDANAKVSDAKIDAGIKKIDDALERFKSNEIYSSYVTSGRGRPGFIRATPLISRERNSDKYTYSLTMSFDVLINVNGEGVGAFIGFYRRYAGAFPNYMTINQNSDFWDQLIEGETSYFQHINIKKDYPFRMEWTLSISKPNCNEIDDVLKKIRAEKDAGSISVVPVFETIKEQPKEERFSIEIAPLSSIFNCSDFK